MISFGEMNVLAAGFDYYDVAKVLGLFAVYFGGLVFATFIHELGHAIIALVVTDQQIALQLGLSNEFKGKLGRLSILLGWSEPRYGFVRYERSRVARGSQTLVALGGPLASLLACVLFGWTAWATISASWLWVLWLGLFVANFRILVVSIWPWSYYPDGPDGEVWLSDALDIWRMWRG